MNVTYYVYCLLRMWRSLVSVFSAHETYFEVFIYFQFSVIFAFDNNGFFELLVICCEIWVRKATSFYLILISNLILQVVTRFVPSFYIVSFCTFKYVYLDFLGTSYYKIQTILFLRKKDFESCDKSVLNKPNNLP